MQSLKVIAVISLLTGAVVMNGFAVNTGSATQVDPQVQALKGDIWTNRQKRDSLDDQIAVIRTGREIGRLSNRLNEISNRLQTNTDAALTRELTDGQIRITAEIGYLADIEEVEGQLAAAHHQEDTNQVKMLEQKIKSDRESIRALYPPNTNAAPTARPARTNMAPVERTVQTDPELQPLLDQIKALNDQLRQDEQSLKSLQKQNPGSGKK